MLRVLFTIVVIALSLYCLVDMSGTNEDRVRLLPRSVWAIAVIFVPIAGSLGWLFAGKPVKPRTLHRRPMAPDDDDDFLRGL